MNTKKLILLAGLTLIPLSVQANSWICTQPPACKSIVSSEYSTGGGSKTIQMLEIGCRTSNGGYVIYTDSVMSAAGFFGVGRLASVNKITFRPGSKDSMDCK